MVVMEYKCRYAGNYNGGHISYRLINKKENQMKDDKCKECGAVKGETKQYTSKYQDCVEFISFKDNDGELFVIDGSTVSSVNGDDKSSYVDGNIGITLPVEEVLELLGFKEQN